MIIPFETFILSSDDRLFWSSAPSFCFVGQDFPTRFFADFFTHLNRQNLLPAPLQRVALHSTTKESLKATLEQSFLGSQSFYWLAHGDESVKWSTDIIPDLCSYQGPNYVAFFTTQAPSAKQKGVTIALEKSITIEQIFLLQKILGISLAEKKIALIKRIFKKSNLLKIHLDAACMLLNYVELTSMKMMGSSEEYLGKLIDSNVSLNALSEHFFAGNKKMFFAAWATLHQEYPDIFWISFWSEQLWRAFHVVNLLSSKNFVLAKKMSFRLPYSFLKNDWKRFSPYQLQQSYEFLYSIDYALKRGSKFPALDLFYLRHFHQ